MENKLICIYSGSIVNVNFYKEILAEENIESLVRNPSQEAIHAGYVTSFDNICELFVYDQSSERAREIIKNIDESVE